MAPLLDLSLVIGHHFVPRKEGLPGAQRPALAADAFEISARPTMRLGAALHLLDRKIPIELDTLLAGRSAKHL